MRVRRGALFSIASAVATLAAVLAPAATRSSQARAFNPATAPVIQRRLLSGLADYELASSGEARASNPLTSFSAVSDRACGLTGAENIKVNQNCLNLSDAAFQGRAQAENETSIAVDPSNRNNLVASFNDYRRGDGGCYSSYSSDGGSSWTDSTPPVGFTNGAAFGAAREYWQPNGDTSVAWDTKGNVYLSCQTFNRGTAVSPNPDLSSALYVLRSTGTNGASWNFPARPVIESPDVEGSGRSDFLDKQLMTVDAQVGSPYQDRIYVSWTTFTAEGTAYIYEAYSADYGETFSAPVLVSGDSDLCPQTYGLPTPNGRCNENQFSQPFTGPGGELYVLYSNFNNAVTGDDNRNQVLVAKSTDGGASFGAPVKAGDYYDLPDCATYQGGADLGRACVPEKAPTTRSIFRATNYGSGAVNPTNGQVVVTYGSYINQYSNAANGCVPAGVSPFGQNLFTGVKTPGSCNNKILISVSDDGGASFTGTTADPRTQPTVNVPAQAGSDQFFQWAAITKRGVLAVSYYDRQYGRDEVTGSSDISLSGSDDMANFAVARVTTSPMPPPTQFSGTFFGDYSGLAVSDVAYPLWMDTRSVDLFLCPGTGTPGVPPAACSAVVASGFQAGMKANDENVMTAAVPIPH